MKTPILVVDDDQMLCEMVDKKLTGLGYSVESVHTISAAQESVNHTQHDLILLDVRLPDGSGLETLKSFKELPQLPEVLIITGEGDPQGAGLALSIGAWDYIEKPLSMRELELQVTRALQYRREKMAASQVAVLEREKIIGSSIPLKACFEQVAQSAATDLAVLITGETGTGKELFSRAIHQNSSRASGPFVVLDCASLPEQLVESVLFGHVKGSFTGADRDREGLLLQADGGTIFMDEVGELPMAIQKSFLRVLQEKRFRPVGSQKEIVSDFRLVAATNRNLEEMVKGKTFRQDLLYRMRAVTIELPSLRQREDDIELLVAHYVRLFCHRYGVPQKGISHDFMETLLAYDWPGNVRELVNCLEYAVTNAQAQEMLFPVNLPVELRVKVKESLIKGPQNGLPASSQKIGDTNSMPPLKDSMEEMEKNYMVNLLQLTGNDIGKACEISGLSRTGLYSRLKKHQLSRTE